MTPRPPTPPRNAGETPAVQRAALLSGWHERGYLPHLKAEGRTYFVTFRLADTLPRHVLESYRFERDDIVKRAQAMGRELTPAEEDRLAELYSERIESHLDAGHGKCWLRESEIAALVADALRHHDGERYDLHAWVVMPNHVHAVLTPRVGYTASSILHNWKSFTAHEVHKVPQASRLQIPKGRPFWQRESYDHLVRNEADFVRVCRYTVENPVKAGLCHQPEDWAYLGVPQASPPADSSAATQASSPADSSGNEKRDAGETPPVQANTKIAGEDACGTNARAASDATKRCAND